MSPYTEEMLDKILKKAITIALSLQSKMSNANQEMIDV